MLFAAFMWLFKYKNPEPKDDPGFSYVSGYVEACCQA